jgi:hypothetical protein
MIRGITYPKQRGIIALGGSGVSPVVLFFLILGMLVFQLGCASRKKAVSNTGRVAVVPVPPAAEKIIPAEPVSPQKLAFVPATHGRNAAVATWLDSISARNQKMLYTAGYRIQVYTGPDRAQAMRAKELLYKQFDGVPVYLTYKQPDFKLKAGDCMSRLEAAYLQKRLNAYFPYTLLMAEQVNLTR